MSSVKPNILDMTDDERHTYLREKARTTDLETTGGKGYCPCCGAFYQCVPNRFFSRAVDLQEAFLNLPDEKGTSGYVVELEKRILPTGANKFQEKDKLQKEYDSYMDAEGHLFGLIGYRAQFGYSGVCTPEFVYVKIHASSKPLNYEFNKIVPYGRKWMCRSCHSHVYFINQQDLENKDIEVGHEEIEKIKRGSTCKVQHFIVNKETIDIQQYLKFLIDISQSCFILENRIINIIIQREEQKRWLVRLKGTYMNKYHFGNPIEDIERQIEKAEKELTDAKVLTIEDKAALILKSGLEKPIMRIQEPLPPVAPSDYRTTLVEPEKPVAKVAGLFNKGRVEKENQEAEKQYQLQLEQYNKAVSERAEYERLKKKYDKKIEEYEMQLTAFIDAKNKYEREIDEYITREKDSIIQSRLIEKEKEIAELKVKKERMENSFSKEEQFLAVIPEGDAQEYLKAKEVLSFIEGELEEASGLLLSQYNSLKEIVSVGLIFPKYNDIVAWSTMYEYFVTGRVTELTGPNGAYNLYESEVRANTIISKLDVITAQLDAIRDNQFTLYQSISEANAILTDINEKTNNMLTEMKKINNTLEQINDTEQFIAYNSQKTAQYAEITAKTNMALTFMNAIWG